MGYSVREICRKLSINPKTFYDHVDHIASRCRRKLAMIDARWVNHADSFQFASRYMPSSLAATTGYCGLQLAMRALATFCVST